MHKKLRIIELTSESRRYDNVKYSERLSCGRIKALSLADLILYQPALCKSITAQPRVHGWNERQFFKLYGVFSIILYREVQSPMILRVHQVEQMSEGDQVKENGNQWGLESNVFSIGFQIQLKTKNKLCIVIPLAVSGLGVASYDPQSYLILSFFFSR